jgi:hypothetical protein
MCNREFQPIDRNEDGRIMTKAYRIYHNGEYMMTVAGIREAARVTEMSASRAHYFMANNKTSPTGYRIVLDNTVKVDDNRSGINYIAYDVLLDGVLVGQGVSPTEAAEIAQCSGRTVRDCVLKGKSTRKGYSFRRYKSDKH